MFGIRIPKPQAPGPGQGSVRKQPTKGRAAVSVAQDMTSCTDSVTPSQSFSISRWLHLKQLMSAPPGRTGLTSLTFARVLKYERT